MHVVPAVYVIPIKCWLKHYNYQPKTFGQYSNQLFNIPNTHERMHAYMHCNSVVTVNSTNLWFSDLYFELVWKNFECVIGPEVTMGRWQEATSQELTTPPPPRTHPPP